LEVLDILSLRAGFLLRTGFLQVRVDILSLIRVGFLLRTGFLQVRVGILSLIRLGILLRTDSSKLERVSSKLEWVSSLEWVEKSLKLSWFVYIFHHTTQLLEVYHTYHLCEIEDIYFNSQNS
jgi:hypothetical protein